MPYSSFNLESAIAAFSLNLHDEESVLPKVEPISPSSRLEETLLENVPIAIAIGTEKARSEAIIMPLLFEIRRILDKQISFFSGRDFTVDVTVGLNGICDFLISRNPEQYIIKAPAVIIIEAKRGELDSALGQCIAEMVAAQRFNQLKSEPIKSIYGCITTGTLWRFIKLEENDLFIDSVEYGLPPVNQILGLLVWMVQNA